MVGWLIFLSVVSLFVLLIFILVIVNKIKDYKIYLNSNSPLTYKEYTEEKKKAYEKRLTELEKAYPYMFTKENIQKLCENFYYGSGLLLSDSLFFDTSTKENIKIFEKNIVQIHHLTTGELVRGNTCGYDDDTVQDNTNHYTTLDEAYNNAPCVSTEIKASEIMSKEEFWDLFVRSVNKA